MPKPDSSAVCRNCQWFDRVNGNGFCKRYAPSPLNRERGDAWTYPLVACDGWCGDFIKTKTVVQLLQETYKNEADVASS